MFLFFAIQFKALIFFTYECEGKKTNDIFFFSDMNALTMFYVANDVIQNCGRKKAPEFREAFSTVLERAVSLEKYVY